MSMTPSGIEPVCSAMPQPTAPPRAPEERKQERNKEEGRGQKWKRKKYDIPGRGEFRPRQTRQLPRVVDLKGRLLSCQSY